MIISHHIPNLSDSDNCNVARTPHAFRAFVASVESRPYPSSLTPHLYLPITSLYPHNITPSTSTMSTTTPSIKDPLHNQNSDTILKLPETNPLSHPPSPQPQIHGLSVTPLTQCTHWHSALDIIAIKHACCQKFYACISCHNALESHDPQVWGVRDRDEKTVFCGACKGVLGVGEYMR